MITLYGSTTSPYVRRLRMYLTDHGHTFVNMQIFEGPDRAELARRNPTMKIPMLEDDGQMLFDSRVIYRYLAQKFAQPALSWDQENLLTLIDAANDSLVQLMILKRSEVDIDEPRLYFRIQRERVANVLAELNKQAEQGAFRQWGYPAISLYCMLDWTRFRALSDISPYPALMAFLERESQRPEAHATDPRQV